MNQCKDCHLFHRQFGGWCSYEKSLWNPENKACNIFRVREEWDEYHATPEEALAEILHEIVDIGESYILQDAARLLDIFFRNKRLRHNGFNLDKVAAYREKLHKQFLGEESEAEQ